jgi:hypothetical protein
LFADAQTLFSHFLYSERDSSLAENNKRQYSLDFEIKNGLENKKGEA